MEFRNKKPSRRLTPSKVTHASQSKEELRIDFNCRCGYCDDHDFFKQTYYEVDHFVPKGILKTIKDTDYSNLVYACRTCNNAKRQKWPTGNEHIHNDGSQGFIDPCSEDYAKQFTRLKDGYIYPQTELGKWMWDSLKLYNPTHHIIWQMEQLRRTIQNLKNMNISDTEIKNKITIFALKYFEYEEQLKGVPEF